MGPRPASRPERRNSREPGVSPLESTNPVPDTSLPAPADALARALLRWYRRHRRELPWRRTRAPYRIWVSEIMLQQTRVAAAVPYYERFLDRFPTVESLAASAESEVLECWSGLGYYRRARQMREAARLIVGEWSGEFPSNYQDLLSLPGIGPYTAAAIASIAFELPHAAVDGTVLRVLTRLLDDNRDINGSPLRRALTRRAQQLIEAAGRRSRGGFTQALMELGATVCTPRAPKCGACPWRSACLSRQRGVAEQRPVKSSKQRIEKVEVTVAVVGRGRLFLLRRRPADSKVMPGFWELPMVEGPLSANGGFHTLGIDVGEKLGEFRHGITFRRYRVSVHRATLETESRPPEFRWLSIAKLRERPLTTITRKALEVAGGVLGGGTR